jgi:hypothetical protein
MQYLLPGTVFCLMVSVGMSLKLTEVVAHRRRMNWYTWVSLLVATFIVPPALALLGGQYLHARQALPAVACYALAAPLIMFAYVRLRPPRTKVAEIGNNQ